MHYVRTNMYKYQHDTAEYIGTHYDGDLSQDPPLPVDDNEPWVWVDEYDTYEEAIEAMREVNEPGQKCMG